MTEAEKQDPLELAEEATAAFNKMIDEVQPELQRMADEANAAMLELMGEGITL